MRAVASLGADVNASVNDGARFHRCDVGDDTVAGALVSLGADVNIRPTDRKWTQWYMRECHLDPEDEGPGTPLTIASRKGHVEVVKLLLEAGACPGVKLSDGRTAHSLATALAHVDVAAILAAV
jgi:ankyrin repeat protein